MPWLLLLVVVLFGEDRFIIAACLCLEWVWHVLRLEREV